MWTLAGPRTIGRGVDGCPHGAGDDLDGGNNDDAAPKEAQPPKEPAASSLFSLFLSHVVVSRNGMSLEGESAPPLVPLALTGRVVVSGFNTAVGLSAVVVGWRVVSCVDGASD